METIRGYCTTNLDGYKMTISDFCKVPNIGERVACLKDGHPATLRVHQITHDYRDLSINGHPFIIVELNL